jgi:esterase/lipase
MITISIGTILVFLLSALTICLAAAYFLTGLTPLTTILFFVGVLAASYLLLGAFFFSAQKSILYQPSNHQSFESCLGFRNYSKLEHKGTRMYYKENTQSERVLVYYHGNGGSACERSAIKPLFERANISLVFPEYTGYSDDQRNPSSDRILADVENVYQFLKSKSYEEVIVYGQSLGSGPASYQASLGNVDTLILISSFSTLPEVTSSIFPIANLYPLNLLLREEYDNIHWLQNFRGNLKVIHGEEDQVIHSKFSKKLFENVPTDNKEYVSIDGRGHNDIWGSTVYREKILETIRK